MAKISRYPEKVLVRISKTTKLSLLQECEKIVLEPAAYCRKAIEHCLEKHCVKGNYGK